MTTALPMMIQKESEFARLLAIVRDLHPRALLEIGVFQGGSLARFATVACPWALLIGVDLEPPAALPHSPGQTLALLRGDSGDPAVQARVVQTLGRQALDFLFIDGDHYTALQDLAAYGPLVRPGGVIALHDIVPGAPGAVGTVPREWQAIKQGRRHLELVENWAQGGYGIGVLWQPPPGEG